MATASAGDVYELPFHNCRNISSPEDEIAGRKVYSGSAPARSVIELQDNENVREYLVEATGKEKKSPSLVHQAIRRTLNEKSDQFSILNGGMTIVARKAELDDKRKVLKLRGASIINGSQTQGELKRFFDRAPFDVNADPSIRYELIVTEDDELIAAVSISRNFQNDVKPLSMAGRLGQLDPLEQSIQAKFPGQQIQKKESDWANTENLIDTEKLIQATFAVMPTDVLKSVSKLADAANKTFAYSQKTRCLRLYQVMSESPKSEAFRCFLDLAPEAWALYRHWKSNDAFKGFRLRAIERDDRGNIINAPDGMIFPILAAYAEFVHGTDAGRWVIAKPQMLTDRELIEAMVEVYSGIADHNPNAMGKSRACYDAIRRVAAIYAKLAISPA